MVRIKRDLIFKCKECGKTLRKNAYSEAVCLSKMCPSCIGKAALGNKITHIDKGIAKEIDMALNEHLKTFMSHRGIKASVGNGSYTDNNITFKVSLSVISKDGNAKTREWTDYERFSVGFDLPDVLGKVIVVQARSMKVMGFRSKAKRYPILLKNVSTGKLYCYTIETFKLTVNQCKEKGVI